MELFVFARFRARLGAENAVAQALLKVLEPSRAEAGCLSIHAFQSRRDAQLFYIHSRWVDESAFEDHARLSHTVAFISTVEGLLDQPLEVTRADLIA